MREELRHNTSIGNLSGIELFISFIFDDGITSRDAISCLCSYVSSSELNYVAALYMFDDLGIVDYHNNTISMTEKGIIVKSEDPGKRIVEIGKLVIEHVIDDGLLNCTNIRFSVEKDAFELPGNAFSLSAAVYRNFLIAVNALHISNEKLYVSSKFEKCFEKVCSRNAQKLTQEDLLKRLDQQQIDGEKAELYVVEYENNRLLQSGKQAKRISQIDVAAGYDILSFKDECSTEYDIYIEVKSYHGKPHFYWSANERNTSMALKDNYYLFLVDVDQIINEGYTPIIIQNPYDNLSENEWLIKPQTYFVCKI